ncbi:hypothetical protein CHS0354_016302 [Potamilus streckersoni]|uniref:Uncharacterized protein n=1 Tax=Potamilus streckersoni TaxID=2493646 RepID=A0AAE0RME4_9BIVA|nr:hypothetical protein CHS0354_016302 [Potamilus streckersoni]
MNTMHRSSKTRMLTKQLFLILLCLHLALSLSLGSLSRILQQEKQQDALESSWPLQKIEAEDGDVLKKKCEGFPCMYNHIASKAGHAERDRTLYGLISGCMRSLSCDPGKRRKRSLNQVAFLRVSPQMNIIKT